MLGVSNGFLHPTANPVLQVPPRSVVSLDRTYGTEWFPSGNPTLPPVWMWKFRIPDDVHVSSQLRLMEEYCNTFPATAVRGQITLPTFEKTADVFQQQVFLGTDLGTMDRHINAIVFNAGDREGAGEIVVRRACDNAVVIAKAIAVPANSTVQFVQIITGEPADATCPRGARGTYTTVVLDQPSIAIVSAVANEEVVRLLHNTITD